ncbi:GM25218 [Drosophila sechellia]|uniref:GM25218 n=1 Tax=Drosophila sechellia TaxID=7238 RepID=B4HLW2_DROSE|nr:GM25218 [Drosophila sechellia]
MKFLLVCTLILGLAFSMPLARIAMALPQLNNEAPMVGDDHHPHQVVRSVHFAEDVQAPHKHDDVACCG